MGNQGLPDIPGYRLEGKLGEGGMAEVFRATQLSLDRPVAIKVVHFGGPQRDKLATRFENEARLIARLEHPCIVGIFEVGRLGDDAMFYAMPLMPHGDLSARIGQLSESEIGDVLVAMCAALDFAHGQGVVHRDIKPANVLFDREQRPRLADFGISRSQDIQGLTNEGDALGSASYMSPEQSRGQQVDARSDLYSLGVLAFELLTGDVPFREADAIATALAHNSAPIPRLPKTRAHWQRLIDKALAKLPADRPANGAAFAAIVRECLANAVPAHPARVMIQQGRRRWTVLVGLAGLVALAWVIQSKWRIVDLGDPAPAKIAMAELDPAFVAALTNKQWFEPEAGSASSWLAGALAQNRSAAHMRAAQAFIDEVGASGLEAIRQNRDAAGVATLDRLHAFLALQQLGDLVASKRYEQELGTLLAQRLEEAETTRNGDRLDALLPLLARTPLAARAAELQGRWHSGVILKDGDLEFALVRWDNQWIALGRQEVTRAQYQDFAKDTRRDPSECRKPGIGGLFRSPDWQDPGFAQTDNHPVVCVSRADAEAYAAWAQQPQWPAVSTAGRGAVARRRQTRRREGLAMQSGQPLGSLRRPRHEPERSP
ncbi:MAG: protein kinase [Ahniella sp.]|nr:protein kinase [Ahniella sp.]